MSDIVVEDHHKDKPSTEKGWSFEKTEQSAIEEDLVRGLLDRNFGPLVRPITSDKQPHSLTVTFRLWSISRWFEDDKLIVMLGTDVCFQRF